jgi:hypothetical protein
MPSLSFTKDNLAKVLDGTKTQTRRLHMSLICLAKPGVLLRLKVGRYGWTDRYVRVVALHEELLTSMSEADARAEGCRDVAEYRRLWNSIYDESHNCPWGMDNLWVYVLDFKLEPKGADARDDVR